MDDESVDNQRRVLLESFMLEIPSWAFRRLLTGGPSSTVDGDPHQRIREAGQVHAYTGCAPRLSLHIPWDRVDDYGGLVAAAAEVDLSIGSIHSNLFQDDHDLFGSLTHAQPSVRRRATAHHAECIEMMAQTGSKDLKIRVPEASTILEEASLRGRQDRLQESLSEIYEMLADDHRLLVDVKGFKPPHERSASRPTGPMPPGDRRSRRYGSLSGATSQLGARWTSTSGP